MNQGEQCVAVLYSERRDSKPPLSRGANVHSTARHSFPHRILTHSWATLNSYRLVFLPSTTLYRPNKSNKRCRRCSKTSPRRDYERFRPHMRLHPCRERDQQQRAAARSSEGTVVTSSLRPIYLLLVWCFVLQLLI